jgi:hypothetical protein
LTWDRVDFDAGTIDLKIKEIIDPLTKEARKDRSKVKMTEEARGALLQAKQGARTGYVIEWNDNAREVHQEGFPGRRGARAGVALEGSPHTSSRSIYAKPSVNTLQPAADVMDLRLRRKRKAMSETVEDVSNDNRKAQI